jgi:hypothetical protein
MDVEHFTAASLRKAIEEVIDAVPPVTQEFHHAGFSQIEVRIDKPRYVLTHLIGKTKSEIAEAMVCLHRRKHNCALTYLRTYTTTIEAPKSSQQLPPQTIFKVPQRSLHSL